MTAVGGLLVPTICCWWTPGLARASLPLFDRGPPPPAGLHHRHGISATKYDNKKQRCCPQNSEAQGQEAQGLVGVDFGLEPNVVARLNHRGVGRVDRVEGAHEHGGDDGIRHCSPAATRLRPYHPCCAAAVGGGNVVTWDIIILEFKLLLLSKLRMYKRKRKRWHTKTERERAIENIIMDHASRRIMHGPKEKGSPVEASRAFTARACRGGRPAPPAAPAPAAGARATAGPRAGAAPGTAAPSRG